MNRRPRAEQAPLQHVGGRAAAVPAPDRTQPAEAGCTEPDAGQPRIRVTNPARLLDLVPYLLGFHPGSSVVVTGAEESRGTVGLTVRIPLHDPGPGASAERLVRILAAQKYARAVVAGYGPEEPVSSFVRRFRDLAALPEGTSGVLQSRQDLAAWLTVALREVQVRDDFWSRLLNRETSTRDTLKWMVAP